MLRFKNPALLPPGGIQFTQPEINWSAPLPLSESVDMLARRVRTLRMQNPTLVALNLPTDLPTITAEILLFNCSRLPGWCVDVDEAALAASSAHYAPAGGGCLGCGR